MQAKRLQTAFDKRPCPPYVRGVSMVSGMAVGNIYDGRYNRSHLVKPRGPSVTSKKIWLAAHGGEVVWFPVAADPKHSRFPSDSS